MSVATALTSTRFRLGAILLVINPLVYLVIEAITASAWNTPAYSYVSNYISDLGVPDVAEFDGRMVNSPLHDLMNAGFVIHGLIFVAAALLHMQAFTSHRRRIAYVSLAIVHGFGISLVGLFHGSQAAADDGTLALHGLGALLAIGAGNAALMVAGTEFRRRSARRLGAAFTALGVVGIAAFVFLLAIAGSTFDGIPERVAVYTVMAAELAAGITLLCARTSNHPSTKSKEELDEPTTHRHGRHHRPWSGVTQALPRPSSRRSSRTHES